LCLNSPPWQPWQEVPPQQPVHPLQPWQPWPKDGTSALELSAIINTRLYIYHTSCNEKISQPTHSGNK
jgi:hypothetical protein